MAAQVFSRVIQVFYIAALARYIGTEGVGKITTATALNGLASLLVAPGITTLLVIDVAANRKLASGYLGNTLLIRLFMGVPFVLLTIGIAGAVGYPRETMYIVCVYAVVYLADTLGQVFSSAFQAFEVIEYDALAQFIRDSLNVSLSLLCIFLRLPLLAIVAVSGLAQICKLVLMASITQRRLFAIQLRGRIDVCKDLILRSVPFGALVILFSMRFQLGTFILSAFDSASAVGIYSSATSLILMLLMLATAFSTSALPAYARFHLQDPQQLPRLYQLSYKYLMLVGFGMGMVILLFGGRIIELIYGAPFRAAGGPVLILSSSLFALMGYSNGPLLNTIGRQRFFAWSQALLVLGDALLCVVLIPRWGPLGAAVANAVACVGGLVLHSIVCHHWLGLPLPWKAALKTLLAVAVAASIVTAVTWIGVSWWLTLLVIAPLAYVLPVLALRMVKVDELRFLAAGMPAPEPVRP